MVARMATTQAEKTIDFRPTTGFSYTITQSPDLTGDEDLVMTGVLEPGHDGPPIHTHEYMSESFEVLSGTLDIFVDGEWRELSEGESFTVGIGEPHGLRNHHEVPVHIVNIHSPGGKMEEFLTTFCALVRAGKIKAIPPKDPRSLFLLANLFATYRAEIEPLKPPHRVFKALATVGRVVGFRLPNPRPTTADALVRADAR